MKRTTYQRVEQLYLQEKSRMLQYIRSRYQHPELEADDIVQEVMLKLLDLAELSTSIEDIAGYAWQALKNLIIDKMRKKKALSFDVDESAELFIDNNNSPEEIYQKNVFAQNLEAALDLLNSQERAIWIATELEGHSFQDLARQWQEPLSTLLSRKNRAEKKIIKLLTKQMKG